MTKRKYRSDLLFIEEGFSCCWHNAKALVRAAELLRDNGLHAQALSVSVLALEELGKLFCLDGLLFARTDDSKAKTFAQSLKSHNLKLDALVLFPMFLGNLASFDPRYGKERRFAQALALSLSDLKERGNALFCLLENQSFRSLDKLKQSGFYAQPENGSFIKPSDAVSSELADAVYHLAWRASTTLDFLLGEGNLSRYLEAARTVRAKLNEKEHQQAEAMGQVLFDQLFGNTEEEADD